MTDPQRPFNKYHAFCSLLIPGLGQLFQKRVGAAIGFFLLFVLTAFLPGLIVAILFVDRFSQELSSIQLLHVVIFVTICFPLMLAYYATVLDAAMWKQGDRTLFKPYLFVGGILFFFVLVILLLPAVPSAREAAKRMQCSNYMKNIEIAFHNYHGKHGHYPPAYTVDEEGNPLHSWRVLILPYIEQSTLYEQIRLDEPWDSEYNRQFHSKAPRIFHCPSNVNTPMPSGCCYSVIVGAEAAFTGSEPREFSGKVSDLSETIFLVERKVPVNWMDPSREISFDDACKGINVDAMGMSSFHSAGVLAGLGDGRVQTISDTVDSKVLRQLLTFDNDNRERSETKDSL